jgi:hypothetical protein
LLSVAVHLNLPMHSQSGLIRGTGLLCCILGDEEDDPAPRESSKLPAGS